jgi:hypothetical protein
MRLLRAGQVNRRCGPRPGRRVYDEAVREALIVIWEASDRICGKRLRPLLPTLVEAMERHGHVQLVPEVRTRLLAMSAATIDRALREIRQQAGTATRRRSAPSAAIRRSVPVRTFDDWDADTAVLLPLRRPVLPDVPAQGSGAADRQPAIRTVEICRRSRNRRR